MAENNDIVSKAWGVVSDAEDTVKKAEKKVEQSAGAVTGIITGLAQKLYGVISPFAKVQSAAVVTRIGRCNFLGAMVFPMRK